MNDHHLKGLRANNPLGFLAALGLLDVLVRQQPGSRATLRWTNVLLSHAVIQSHAQDLDDLASLVLADRDLWHESIVLEGFDGYRPDDVKPDPEMVARWIVAAEQSSNPGDLPLLHGLISEGAFAGKGDTKPTHLHFTAGQQKFLAMARDLRDALDAAHVLEALGGPWPSDSILPVFGWDNSRGERLHALSSHSPSSMSSREFVSLS